MTEVLLAGFGMFWGRLHPIAVHFPIALILVLLALLILVRFKRFEGAKPLIPVVLWASFLSCLLAIWMGLSLEDTGRSAGELLDEHKTQGIILTILLGLALAGYYFIERNKETYVLTFTVLGFLLSMVVGHHGGAITHGEAYLSAVSPAWLGGKEFKEAPHLLDLPDDPDSIKVLEDLIHPILQQKCMHCHQSENRFGGLNLSSLDSLLAGGKSGQLWEAGNSHGSRLIRRVSMSRENPEFMPPSGEPLSFQETRLISWWIEEGAKEDLTIAEAPKELKDWLWEEMGIDVSERPYLEKIAVSRPEVEIVRNLSEAGWKIDFLADGSGVMEVKYVGNGEDQIFDGWDKFQTGITWLDVSDLPADIELPSTVEMPHLTRLNLSNRSVSVEDLERFSTSPHLESVSLVGARLEPGALMTLSDFPELKRVFLWKADVNSTDLERLRRKVPDLDINQGFTFQSPE